MAIFASRNYEDLKFRQIPATATISTNTHKYSTGPGNNDKRIGKSSEQSKTKYELRYKT